MNLANGAYDILYNYGDKISYDIEYKGRYPNLRWKKSEKSRKTSENRWFLEEFYKGETEDEAA